MHNKRNITHHIKRMIVLILIGASISSCSLFREKEVATTTTTPVKVCQQPPRASEVVMRGINWVVVEGKDGQKYVGLHPKDYENLSLNMAGIIALLKQKNGIISYYSGCIERE